jgi:hypothetical protein
MTRLLLPAVALLLALSQQGWSDDEEDDPLLRKDALLRELAEKIRESPPPAKVTAAAITKALPDKVALIDFLEVEPLSRKEGKQLLAIVYRSRGVERAELGPILPIQAALTKYLAPIESQPPGEVDAEAAHDLRKRLWAPLAKHLSGAERVFIAPDGFLWGIPWPCLPGSKKGSYLIEEYSVEVVRSAAHLLEKPEKRPTSTPLLIGGLDHGEGRKVKPLSGSAEEVQAIAKLYEATHEGSRVEALSRADKASLVARLGGKHRAPSHLHLAIPSFSGPPEKDRLGRLRAGLAMGLHLTGANTSPAKGLITVTDVAGLDLRGCQLVVLTGAGTGRAIYARGEGGLGLSLAFGMAGARCVIGAVWRPEDREALAFLKGLYSRIWAKEPEPVWKALREAQKELLAGEGGKRAHPSAWAGWVISHQGR